MPTTGTSVSILLAVLGLPLIANVGSIIDAFKRQLFQFPYKYTQFTRNLLFFMGGHSNTNVVLLFLTGTIINYVFNSWMIRDGMFQ